MKSFFFLGMLAKCLCQSEAFVFPDPVTIKGGISSNILSIHESLKTDEVRDHEFTKISWFVNLGALSIFKVLLPQTN